MGKVPGHGSHVGAERAVQTQFATGSGNPTFRTHRARHVKAASSPKAALTEAAIRLATPGG